LLLNNGAAVKTAAAVKKVKGTSPQKLKLRKKIKGGARRNDKLAPKTLGRLR